MDKYQVYFLLLLAFSSLVAFLFLRLLYWGFSAHKNYWSKPVNIKMEKLMESAQEKGMKLPFFSIMVPARDESAVIANTIENLATLEYPKDLYEIVIITDAKELKNNSSDLTTQAVVEEKIAEFKERNDVPFLKHVVVPYDFDGQVNGKYLGKEVPSTKARALNYSMAYLAKETNICGFYDAESRPEKHVLKYIASRWVATSGKQKIWQGSVFQVRNFYQLGCLTQIMSLYQAVSHDWYLPFIMKHLPFLGGTNLFLEKGILVSNGGFDPKALSEDLELGVHQFLETGEWPEFMPIVSTEQTPAKYRHYFRQRLRWGSGHLQVYDKLKANNRYEHRKKGHMLRTLFWKGHSMWYLYQFLVIMPIFFLSLTLQGLIDRSLLNDNSFLYSVNIFLEVISPIYFIFTIYLFKRYSKYIDFQGVKGFRKYAPVFNLLLLPILGFFIALPYTVSLVLRTMKCQPRIWVKTPRTQEVRIKAS